MEQVPDDLRRIVFAFAGPNPGARQVAARARTLDEYVEYRLVGEPDNYHESRTIEEGVAHTGAQINLSWTGVRTLPASLQTTTTLRVLEVWQGGWLAGPCRHYQTGEFYLQAGRDHIKLANAADEIARRDAVLRPLSLALPELRILMHANDMARTPKGASMRWWHARCGYDWTDPVFF